MRQSKRIEIRVSHGFLKYIIKGSKAWGCPPKSEGIWSYEWIIRNLFLGKSRWDPEH